MDLFKKGTLKSQSLNSRFLASNPQSSNYTRTQPIQSVKPSAPTNSNVNTQPSKLKLTTTRQSSALRLNRDQNSSPGVNDQSQSIAKDVAAERKAPVWNKGMAPVKSAKDYTDEELKAMHGISLVSRKSENANVSKEGRWDDSDEDDDWGDTIDFGDGTKVTIGQTPTTVPSEPAKLVTETPPPKPVEPVVKHFAFPPPRGEGSPWKRSEPIHSNPIAAADFPPVSASKTPNETRPITAGIEMPPRTSPHVQNLNVRSPQEYNFEQRPRAESFNKDGRMQQSGDARYSYEQNTYDRHWQNPVPQTREIFNSTTGRFEQIEAVQKNARRPSHSERRPTETSGRHQTVSGDARKQGAEVSLSKTPRITPAIQTKTETNGHATPSERHDVEATKVPEKAEITESKKEEGRVAAEAPPLDPSSQEFIDMQKKLMAERREQAIQRRKDQEAEEVARKERARKKAAELAAQAEAAAQKEAAAQAELEKAKARPPLKLASRGSLTVERNIAAQQAVSETIQARTKVSENVQGISNAAVERPKQETWQRNEQTAKAGKVAVAGEKVFEKGIGSHESKSGTNSIERPARVRNPNESHKIDTTTPSRNVWGPIGPQNGPNSQGRSQNRSETILGSFGLDNPPQSTQQAQNGTKSPPPMSRPNDNIASPSWSAFDGIARSRNMTTPNENRNYNVFDAADEVITPERHRNSPPGQSQANRTSSRFFPSAVQAITSPKSVKALQPFVSPALPPRLDADNTKFFGAVDVAPVLSLPEAQIDWSHKNGVTSSKDAKHARHGGRAWLDTQTRSVWEIKPLRDGQAPRIKVPYSEKQLDWSRKERPGPSTMPAVTQVKEEPEKITKSPSTALPAIPAWTLPKNLEITSKSSSVAEPLIPPHPALKLPSDANEAVNIEPLSKKRKVNRFLDDKFGRYYTTKPALQEENDIMSPIRVKTMSAETRVPRKFGKRVDPNQINVKKVSDVKRQPVNMSDAPGGAGFKRGFANRVRLPATNSTTSSSNSKSTTPNPDSKSTGQSAESGQQSSVSILQRTMASPEVLTAEGRMASPGQTPLQRSHSSQRFETRSPLQQVQQVHREALPPQQQQYKPVLSRIAPPGLSAPVMPASSLSSTSAGEGDAAQAPAPAPRGPPGIVLPGLQ